MDSIQSCFRCGEKDLGGASQQPTAGSAQSLPLASSFPHSKTWELDDGSASCGVFGVGCALFGVRGCLKICSSELSARRRR